MKVALTEHHDGKVKTYSVYDITHDERVSELLRLLNIKLDETHAVSSIQVVTTNF